MNDKFISVPLCTLSMHDNYKQLTNLIMDYGIVEFSKKDTWRGEIENYDEDTTDENFALWAFERVFNLKGVDGKTLINNHSIVEDHIRDFESLYGKDAYFRIGMSLLFDAYKGEFSEREFRVYIAIRSVLGANSKYSRITMDRISYRMYGCKSLEAFQESNITNSFSHKQIKNSINKLIDRNLIVSFTNRNRFTYYSTRLSLNELIEAVAMEVKKKKAKRPSNKEIQNKINELVNA